MNYTLILAILNIPRAPIALATQKITVDKSNLGTLQKKMCHLAIYNTVDNFYMYKSALLPRMALTMSFVSKQVLFCEKYSSPQGVNNSKNNKSQMFCESSSSTSNGFTSIATKLNLLLFCLRYIINCAVICMLLGKEISKNIILR